MKKKIVLLEDDTDIREIIEYLLTNLGNNFEVKSYETVETFMAAEHTDASLFLLDIMLPDGDGLDVCSQLHKDNKTTGIPIIMMSAHKHSIEMSNCRANDFIQKPFNIDDFLSRIGKLLA